MSDEAIPPPRPDALALIDATERSMSSLPSTTYISMITARPITPMSIGAAAAPPPMSATSAAPASASAGAVGASASVVASSAAPSAASPSSSPAHAASVVIANTTVAIDVHVVYLPMWLRRTRACGGSRATLDVTDASRPRHPGRVRRHAAATRVSRARSGLRLGGRRSCQRLRRRHREVEPRGDHTPRPQAAPALLHLEAGRLPLRGPAGHAR